jgi:acyl-CoA dehydrogenase
VDFNLSPEVSSLLERIEAFMDEHVYPVELEAMQALDQEVGAGTPYPEILVEIRARARQEGLWNLFMPDERYGAGLPNWEYGVLCEEMGRSPAVAPMAFNCSAPDTGNMEILAEHGTDEQRSEWLQPLLDGEIRSCFSMTEPEVSGSDPTTLQTRAELDGDEWVIDGHKWFTSGAVGASVAIVMCVTDPDAHPYARASMIQDRLGPGRIHHCMRAIGTAERAIELMCRRANERETFGGKLAEKQFVQDFVAKSRMEVDQARLLTLNAAWRMDTEGKRAARQAISMIKVVAANVVMDVLDRAIQVHGALGMSDDTPLAWMWRFSRMLRVADGPDEVHKMVIARRELHRWAKEAEAEPSAAPSATAPPEPAKA